MDVLISNTNTRPGAFQIRSSDLALWHARQQQATTPRYTVRCLDGCGRLCTYPSRERAEARVERHHEFPSQADHHVVIEEAK